MKFVYQGGSIEMQLYNSMLLAYNVLMPPEPHEDLAEEGLEHMPPPDHSLASIEVTVHGYLKDLQLPESDMWSFRKETVPSDERDDVKSFITKKAQLDTFGRKCNFYFV